MEKYKEILYPEYGEKIDEYSEKSKYIIEIENPNDVSEAFNQYAINFYKSGQIVSDILLEASNEDISELDTYIFPLAFLYRHSIELKLKAIAFKNVTSVSDREEFIKSTYHNLLKLLDDILLNYKKEELEVILSKKELQYLKRYFSDISKIDKESDSFRYPFHIGTIKKFDSKEYYIQTIFEEQIPIDLIKFSRKFEAVYEILDKWYLDSNKEVLQWKKLEPVFLEEGGYYYEQSVVGYGYLKDKFYPYASAYFKVANRLKKHMKEQFDINNHYESNCLFIPMCYLYRNSVELNLKAIWFEEVDENFQKKCKSMTKKKHSIIGMWNLIKPHVENFVIKDKDNVYIKTLEDYCQQLHDFDQDSSKFRYPVNKNIQPYFKNKILFDFLRTGNFLESLNNGLESLESAFSAINEYKNEIYNYW